MQLGLDAEQVMLPADHVLLTEAQALPGILVVRLANGGTHFVVVWRLHGPFVQLMDPGTGRRWISAKRFFDEIYVHKQSVASAEWRDWAGSEQFLQPLRRRLADLGAPRSAAERLIERATSDHNWQGLAALDGAVRMMQSIIHSGGLRRGERAARVIEQFADQPKSIPREYWSVRRADGAGEDQLLMRGAVLVHVRGRVATPPTQDRAATLSAELAAALGEPPSRPGRDLLRVLMQDGVLAPSALTFALVAATGGVLLEAVLLRGLLDLGRELALGGQRLAAMALCLLSSRRFCSSNYP